MRYIAVFIVIALACNEQQGEEKGIKPIRKDSAVSQYPKVVDSLGVQALYDNTRWVLYCIYSDDTCLIKNRFNVTAAKTFGTLELRFNELRQRNDTIEIDFLFYANDTLRYDMTTMANHKRLATGVGYRKGNDTTLFYTSETTMRYFWEKGPGSRYGNPLQPEVISYIRKNKDNLHPWFREKAKRKGILQ